MTNRYIFRDGATESSARPQVLRLAAPAKTDILFMCHRRSEKGSIETSIMTRLTTDAVVDEYKK